MRAWIERNRGHLTTFLAGVGLVGLFQWWSAQPPGVEIVVVEPSPAPTITVAPTTTPAPVAIFVSGEVVQPGVYTLAPGSRVDQAIVAAGGFTAAADQTVVNLAQMVQDEMHVHVPARGAAPTPPPVSAAAPSLPSNVPAPSGSAAVPGPININAAGTEELDTLPGIGPAIAQRIVDYRTANGPFGAVEEIKQVQGIGDKLFAKIQGMITVGP